MKKLAVIIDDDPDDIQLLQETLQDVDTSIDCISFGLPVAAIDALSNPAHMVPNYVFLDFNMPIMNGLECFNALKTIPKLAASTFILNSTSINNEVEKKFLSGGGHFIFQKPYSACAYIDMVKKIIAQVGE